MGPPEQMEWVASAARRRTVFCTDDEEGENAFDGDNLKGLARRQASVECRVREFVTAQIASLKANARLDESRRWTDPEFGPNEGDPDGRRSLFRNPRKATPGYPQPHEIAWLRPGYSNESDIIEDQFCNNATLFRQPSTEATLVQGRLGDCWLLNALAVASTRAGLIESVFWRRDDFKDFGIFVCRFFKDGAWYYVIVDDRIPVMAGEHGQPCFAHTKDASELWLPLLEKAYAKLHMSYDSLTGGDLEVALREVSGWATSKCLLSAFDIVSPLQDLDATWRFLRTALDYGSAIGCIARPEDRTESATMLQQLPNNSQSSSQAMAREKSTPNGSLQEDSVLPAALRGLETRHAYGIVAAKTVRATRVVLVRNVWGFGQWKGPWSRGSPEFAAHEKDLQSLFPHRDLERNECFLMAYEDFSARFSSLISTIQLKTVFALDQLISVGSQWSGARVARGRWTKSSSGGGPDRETWNTNPFFRFRVVHAQTRVYVQVSLRDHRMATGRRLCDTLYSFTICRLDVNDNHRPVRPVSGEQVPGSSPGEAQPMYTYSTSCEKEIYLSAGDYALVPHTFDRGQTDDFVLTMYFDKSIFLENSEALGEDGKEVVTGNPFQDCYVTQGDESMPQPMGEINDQENSVLAVNGDQREQARALRAELFKERLAAIAEERGISLQSILAAFQGYGRLSRVDFKRSMVDLQFSVSEIPDADFEALAYPETTVSCAKVRGIFEQNMLRQTLLESRPGEHADDLIFRPPVTEPGQLSITVHEAQDLVMKDGGPKNTQLLRFTPAQSNEAQRLRAVQRSEVMRVDGKLVILCAWLVPLDTKLAAVLRANRPAGGDNFCVPVAYEVSSGLEYSFASSPWLWVFDHELHDDAFWKNHFVAWATDSRLCIEAIPNVLRSSLDHDKANEPFPSPRSAAYVPDRRRVVHDILGTLRAQAPQGHEEVTSPATFVDKDAVAMTEKNQSWAEPRPKTHPLAASLRVVETLYSASNRLASLDRERNVALWKLQSYSGSARRAMSQKVVARGVIPKELSASSEELAKFEQVSENPASITPNPETSDTEASTTEALKADDALVSLFCSSIFGDVILGQVFEAIMYGRDAEIQAGGWRSGSSDEMNEASMESSIATPREDERLVYSGIVPMVGEAKVLKHQLSRSANLQAWFEKFDRDGNGLIEAREFERALEALGFRLSALELESLLTHLDTNGDGQINPDEFIAFVNAETDSATLSESEVLLEHVVSALASSGVNREALTQPWSVGLDWFKLRHFASQLRELTMTCPLLAQRSLFMAAPKAVGIRAYRVAHLFETKEAFAAFLARHHERHVSEQNQEAPPVRSPERARSMLRCIVEAVQRGGEVSTTLPPVGIRDGGKADFDLDVILERLPKFLSRHSSVSVSEKIKSGELARGILEAYARAEVAASVQATSPDAESEDTAVRAMLERYAADVASNVGREGMEEDEEQAGSVTLTLAEEMRMLVDDALIRCKASHVNRAVLARMLSPDRVLAVSLKLRHALRQQRALRDNPSLFLVDVYASMEKQATGSDRDVERRVRVSPELDVVYRRDRGSVRIERNKINDDSSRNTLRIYARNPCNGRVLELDKVLIDENLVTKLPKASLGPGGWTYEVTSDTQNRMSSDERKEFAMSDLREVHVLQELVSRLSVCKSASSKEMNRLALHLRECPEKVNFVRRMLDSLNESSFFVQVTDVAVHFRADRGETGITGSGSCKSAVVAALREQQGGRLAAALSTLDVTLQVVFEETQGDFREEMPWAEFTAYLAEERNSLVEVCVRPGKRSLVTRTALDGGRNPVFADSSLTVPFAPASSASRNLVVTRVCRLAKSAMDSRSFYAVLFVHHVEDPSSSRLGIVAYDPRSNDEFAVVVKTVERRHQEHGRARGRARPRLLDWGSPKKRAQKQHFGSRDQDDAGDQTSETPSGAYSAETLAVLDKYGVVQGDSTTGVELETSFPLQDDRAWDEVLEHLCLGSCLTPHVEATMYNVAGLATISTGSASLGEAVARREIGKARFPLSIVTESPGVGLTRWLNLVDAKHGECGRLRVSFRFDDSSMIAAKENANVSEFKRTSSRSEGAGRDGGVVHGQVKEEEKKGMEEEQKDASNMSIDKFAIPAGGDEMLPAKLSGRGDGKEDSSLELVHRRAQTAKDYAVLAQRLREEMLEAKTKLAESERARGELEQTVSRNEDRLRQTRGELEHQQRRLRDAEAQVRAAEPRKPKRGADAKTLEEHAREKREHEARLRELDVLREDNEKLRMVTDTREAKLRSELQQLRTQLQETELKLRVEATEKQELLGSVERANAEAHEGLARTSARVAANILASGNTTRTGGISRKPREQRERERRRRDEWLQTRLQADYKTYRREFDGCVGEVERQLRARRPDDPRRPLKALEQLLLAQAVVTHPEPRVTAEGFEEALANFGLGASPRDLDLLKAHFDTHSDGTLAVDDFLDTLRDHMDESDTLAASGAATATHGFRGVQAVQRKRY